MLIWKFCFYFSFVLAICSSKMRTCHVIRDLFTEKVLSCWYNFNSRDLFNTMTELSLLCIIVIRNLFRIFVLLDALNLLVVYVKGSRELKLSQRESTFSVNRSRVTWRVLILTNISYTFDLTK